jgi:hypothetical protein
VSILDNSLDNTKPVEVMQLRNGIIISRQEVLPQWLDEKYPIIEKLSRAYEKLRANKFMD